MIASAKLDHIGIAVRSLAEAGDVWRRLGFAGGEVEHVRELGVRVQKFDLGGSIVELLEDATGGDGVIGKFLASRGPGVHHLSFLVQDLAAATAEYAAAGYRIVYDRPRVGAGGCRVNFLHPKSTQGVLIEIMEAP